MNTARKRSPARKSAPVSAASLTVQDELAQRIAALNDLTAPQLREEWRRLYRGQPPRLSRDLLIARSEPVGHRPVARNGSVEVAIDHFNSTRGLESSGARAALTGQCGCEQGHDHGDLNEPSQLLRQSGGSLKHREQSSNDKQRGHRQQQLEELVIIEQRVGDERGDHGLMR